MKSGMMFGIALVVLGVIGLAYQGISWTTRERVVDLPGIQIDADKEHSIPIAPVAAGIALAVGAVLVAAQLKKA